MAKGKKSGGKNFEKGVSGNPLGRATLPKEIRDLRKLSVEELELMISTLLYATDAEISEVEGDPQASVLQKIVCSILKSTHESGSMGQFDLLLNRVIGKVKEKVELDIVKPSILEKRDGTKVIFNMTPHKKDDSNG